MITEGHGSYATPNAARAEPATSLERLRNSVAELRQRVNGCNGHANSILARLRGEPMILGGDAKNPTPRAVRSGVIGEFEDSCDCFNEEVTALERKFEELSKFV